MAQEFFATTSPFGSLTGWEPQNDNPSTARQRAQALGADGDEIAHHEYDDKTSVSANYVCKADNATIPKYGDILSGYHVDQVSVSFSNQAFVTMTITGHKHGSTAHPACRKYTGTLTEVASMFGCPSTVPGCTIPSGAGVNSITYTLTGQHVDVPNGSGNFLAAGNYDGVETVDVELCDNGEITPAHGWTLMTSSHGRSNTAATTTSASLEHHLSGTNPTPSASE